MIEEVKFVVTIPATTANLGPGFDSVGLALALYMKVNVTAASEWTVVYDDEEFIDLPRGQENLIVKTICEVANKFGQKINPLQLRVESEIPLGKGLGSSATAVAAGIEIANHLLVLDLSPHEKVCIGSEVEGHIDNISAALLGGTTIAYFTLNEMEIIHIPEPKVGAVILVPPKILKTEESRGLLPTELLHSESTLGSAASNVMAAAIATNDWERAGRMMEKDVFHEAYRKHLFPDFDAIRKKCKELRAYGMTISGAGPSLFIAVQQGHEKKMAEQLALHFPYYEAIAVKPSLVGTVIE